MSPFFQFYLKFMVAFMLCSALSVGMAHSAGEVSYSLPNGLKVILVPQQGKSLISARVAVRAGSSSEAGREEFGLAHLMEHMAFKGTSKRKVGEISTLIQQNGGSTNAYTSFDETVYYMTLPSEKLELALDLLSDMIFRPTYDPEEYAKEKEVVLEEIRMGMDNPGNRMVETFMLDAFTASHPYGHRVIGWPDTVKNATREVALAFHDKFYRPDNCVVIVTGGFDSDEAKKLVADYFGGFGNPGSPLPPIEAPEPRNDGPKATVIYSREATLPKMFLGFHAPAAGQSLSPTADLLASVLSGGRSSRFDEKIKNEKGLVTSVQSASWDLKRGGVFYITFETERDKLIPALREFVAELNAVSSDLPREEELNRAKAIASKSFVDVQESPWSLGSVITSYELSSGDYRLKDAYLPIWDRLSPEDLASLAQSVFTPGNATATLLLPEGTEPVSEEEIRAELQKLSLPAVGKASSTKRPPFETYSLSNGARLLVLKDKSLPMVELRAGVLGGRYAEEKGKEGAVNLMAMVWAKASKKRGSAQTDRDIDNLGLSLEGFAGRTSTGLEASFLSGKWRESLSLFTELLTSPAFDEKDFELRKEEELDYILSMDESLSERVMRISRKLLYRSHPFSQDLNGTRESVSALTRDDIEKVYNELVRPESLVIAVSGDIDEKEFIKALEADLKDWRPLGKGLKVEVPGPPPPLSGVSRGSEALDREQSHIVLGFLAPDMDSPDRAPMEVLNSVLSGMGGVLFTELRDKRSLAYSVASDYGAYKNVGAVVFYIGTASEKSAEAYEGILGIIREAREKPFSEEAVEGAKSRILGMNLMSHLTLASVTTEALGYTLAGQPLDFNDKLLESIKKVSPADVQRVAKEYLDLDNTVLSIVGKESSIGLVEGLLSQEKKE